MYANIDDSYHYHHHLCLLLFITAIINLLPLLFILISTTIFPAKHFTYYQYLHYSYFNNIIGNFLPLIRRFIIIYHHYM